MTTLPEIPTGSSVQVAVKILIAASAYRSDWKPYLLSLGYFKNHKNETSADIMIYQAIGKIRKANDLCGIPTCINGPEGYCTENTQRHHEQSSASHAMAGRPTKRMAVIVEEVHAMVQALRVKQGLQPWDFSKRGSSKKWDERCLCRYVLEAKKILTAIGSDIHCVVCRLPWGDDRARDLRAKTLKAKKRNYIMPKHLAASAGSLS